jgi:spermidine synthase
MFPRRSAPKLTLAAQMPRLLASHAMDSQRRRVRTAALELFLASFVVLFQELAMIRWLPGQVRVLAYFPNLILISAFLGLGIGCLRAGRKSLLWLWPVGLLVTVCAAAAMSRVVFTHSSSSEHLWLLYHDLPRTAPVIHGVRLPIIVLFVLSAASFIPLGQFVAERLNRFREISSVLWGYCWDLGGSLAGVIAFSAISFAGLFPVTWFGAILLLGALLYRDRIRALAAYAAVALAVLGVVHTRESADHYSPYYALTVVPENPALVGVLANGSLHQYAADLRGTASAVSTSHAAAITGYHHPYRQLTNLPQRVLVLGAGTGNDVAVLLDEGVERIDAVEIDPTIIDLGRRIHPNKPYDSDRVELFNTDARAFLNTTDREYDLIVFGTLDSMTRLSALSNVRLDNFVYTLECLKAAKQRLRPGGGVVLYFAVNKDYIDAHLLSMLAIVFRQIPAVYAEPSGFFNRAYMSGPAFAHLHRNTPEDEKLLQDVLMTESLLPQDDWPYLYLAGRSISPFYASLIGIFLLLAAGGIFAASPEMRSSVAGRGRVDVEMMLFGTAFLLLETHFVTSINLIWGATWITSSVVFGAILLVILLSTIVMKLRPIPWGVAGSGLVLTLVIAFAIQPHVFLGLPPALKLAACTAYVGIPVFFASACFALSFAKREHPNLAFGWNLLGAVAGGMMEILSMVFGLRAMLLLAAMAYLAIMLLHRRRAAQAPEGAAAS